MRFLAQAGWALLYLLGVWAVVIAILVAMSGCAARTAQPADPRPVCRWQEVQVIGGKIVPAPERDRARCRR